MKIDFMRSARIWVVISLVVTLIGVGSLAIQGLNVSIDFRGGTVFDLKFEQAPAGTGAVRQAIGADFGEVVVQQAGDESSEYLVRTRPLNQDERDRFMSRLESALGKFEVLQADEVQPIIGRELTRQALFAVLIASVLQLVYVSFRFEFRQGVTAVMALVHDAIITLGLVSLLRIEVGAPFVAAILTVIGYSINDTIVIFDRIRENLRLRKKGEALSDLTNRSVHETLRRSINTVVTTLLAIGAVYVFGGRTTRDFALTLLIGIASGAYSSIFIASPIWVWWRQRDEARRAKAGGRASAKPA